MMRFLICLTLMAGLCACAEMPKPEGKPLPDLTYEHLRPLPVEVQAVEVIQDYNPGADDQDISSRFAVPPHVAIQRYARGRLEAQGTSGRLQFIIQDATVYHRIAEQENQFVRWTGFGREDIYEVFVKLKLVPLSDQGRPLEGRILSFERTLVMPEGVSLAEREKRQSEFLETFIQDIDESVTRLLADELQLVYQR